MYKILLFTVVFFAGIALGGGLRYSQVEAQLSSVEVTGNPMPTSNAPLGNAGGGSCG
ncbi:hypothetical protein GW777_06045 [Candidatus Peregrinibacteria bacterium]|nr:hypothetical protein [bacterium]NCQ55848.1 hypothetical protein [Candidatus Parcubacteria bacterium]NCS67915.1 hypothetical protein [Candidatus Peregrinibacteria bacterium]